MTLHHRQIHAVFVFLGRWFPVLGLCRGLVTFGLPVRSVTMRGCFYIHGNRRRATRRFRLLLQSSSAAPLLPRNSKPLPGTLPSIVSSVPFLNDDYLCNYWIRRSCRLIKSFPTPLGPQKPCLLLC